ncbi:MAG: alpha-amylase family glycosyl hydrolase [Myxococcota bacterium]
MSRLSSPPLLLAALLVLAPSCGDDETPPSPPTRECASVVWAQPENPGAAIGLTGSWNGWDGVTVPMKRRDDGWYVAYFQVPPGEHGYLVVEDGEPRIDVYNPLTAFRGEQEVSLLLVDDCSVPLVSIDDIRAEPDGRVRVEATFEMASQGHQLASGSVKATTLAGVALSVQRADPESGKIVIAGEGLARGKHTIRIEAVDSAGQAAESARAVAWVQPAAETWQDGLLYQVMIDRFLGDGGKRLAPPTSAGGRAGGTLDGVRAAIESGEIEALGATGIWLSPVYLNPTEAREGPWDGRMYEGYHGYWPQESRVVDPRIGGEQALHELVAAAHARGLRVLLDIVPNHVYETNPIFLAHQGDGWFHDGADKCICGNPPCPWSTHIATCWFTPYLPDYRWKTLEVMRHGSTESLWWTETFDLDGVRVDAVPMMPRAATRRIARELRDSVEPRSEQFLLGEIFTGGGQGGIDEIRYHLGPDGLDSAFHFPLMWSLRTTIAHDAGSFRDIAELLDDADASFEGAGATIAHIVGNHDTTRFLSEANGDAGNDPWDDPPEQPEETEPYDRHRMAMTVVMTLPGLPVIYYGDELGLAGGGDPDCRRVMPDASELNDSQQRLLEDVRRLGQLRRCSHALRRGDRIALAASKDTFAYLRDAGDGWPVLVAMSKAPGPAELSLPLEGPGASIPSGEWVDVLSGETISMGGTGQDAGVNARVRLDSLTARVLVHATDPCR